MLTGLTTLMFTKLTIRNVHWALTAGMTMAVVGLAVIAGLCWVIVTLLEKHPIL